MEDTWEFLRLKIFRCLKPEIQSPCQKTKSVKSLAVLSQKVDPSPRFARLGFWLRSARSSSLALASLGLGREKRHFVPFSPVWLVFLCPLYLFVVVVLLLLLLFYICVGGKFPPFASPPFKRWAKLELLILPLFDCGLGFGGGTFATP